MWREAVAAAMLPLLLLGCCAAVAATDASARLAAIGADETLSAAERGAALAELAMAHEGLFVHWMPAHERNVARTVELFSEAAAFGNETAQFRLGSLHATGALGVPKDQVKMLLNYYFAALAGSLEAQMALGFRHSIGLGVPKDCNAAVLYFELAANKAVDMIEMEGVAPLNERERLSLEKKSTGYFGGSTPRGEDAEIVEYYRHAAEKGEVSALVALGQINFYGARGVERDHRQAFHFFQKAAANGEPVAQTSLGHMLVKGLSVERDFDAAFRNFSAAAEAGSAGGMNGLGYMYLYGLGVEQDREKAQRYFNDAADHGLAEANYNLGALYLTGVGVRRRNYPTALHHFQLAVQKGHIQAMHKLAQMNLHAIGVARSCENALHLFKAVAERGEPIKLLSQAFTLWSEHEEADKALQLFLIAAELGFEVAQSNAAWLLDDGADISGGLVPKEQVMKDEGYEESFAEQFRNIWREIFGVDLPGLGTVRGSQDALRLYELAAEQGNVEARLKIGDYFYYAEEPDFELASHHYKKASDLRNPQAMFNLGWMHQNGIGLEKDFHLAKRFFDLAEAAHADAKIPVSLALSGLWLQRMYRAVFFNEHAADLPRVSKTFARWMGGNWEIASSLSAKDFELEDDTIVALFLFVLLVFVLVVRSRRQRRTAPMHHQEEGELHPHQD